MNEKIYLELTAFELGQIWASLGFNKKNLSEQLQKKVDLAIAQVYLDSGFTRDQVFGNEKPKVPKK
jgi:hypothetical protein